MLPTLQVQVTLIGSSCLRLLEQLLTASECNHEFTSVAVQCMCSRILGITFLIS